MGNITVAEGRSAADGVDRVLVVRIIVCFAQKAEGARQLRRHCVFHLALFEQESFALPDRLTFNGDLES